jgi:hypothetical protein
MAVYKDERRRVEYYKHKDLAEHYINKVYKRI